MSLMDQHRDQQRNDDHVRSHAFQWRASEASSDGDGLLLEGYASIFGGDGYEVMDWWDGPMIEIVDRGAFKKTIAEQGSRVRLLLEHGRSPLLGNLPLGAIETLREDDVGLFVRARLHDNWLVQPVADAIRSQALAEMSFAFRIVKEEITKPAKAGDLPVRHVKEAALREVSVVTWGANPETSVGLRSWADKMPAELRAAVTIPAGASANTDGSDTVSEGTSDRAAADGTADGEAAVVRDEPVDLTTRRRERRQWAALLRGVVADGQAGAAASTAA